MRAVEKGKGPILCPSEKKEEDQIRGHDKEVPPSPKKRKREKKENGGAQKG